MSTEEGLSNKHSCPCGKGDYLIVSWSDDLWLQLRAAETSLESAKGAISEYAKARFEDSWRKHFLDKNKKTVWRELTREGEITQAFPRSTPTYALQV